MTTSTSRRRFTRAAALAAIVASAGAMTGLLPASAGATGLLEPTTTHNVTPLEKSFPADRACPEGTTLAQDQFQSLTQGVESATVSDSYEIGGVTVTVTLTVHADNSFDFEIENGVAAQVFVKGGQDSGYLLYQYDPPVAGATNTGPVNHDTGLHDGYVSGDSYQDVSHLDFCLIPVELIALDVATTATAAFDRTISWSLDKSVTPSSHTGTAGEDAGSSTWTVVATKTVTLGNFSVTGTVTVTNSNDFAVPFAIAHSLSDGTGATVSCPSPSVPANDRVVCTFTAAPSGATATQSTAVVTPNTPGLDEVSATASVSFLANVTGDETVTVDDDRDTEGQFPTDISSSTTFDYGETFPCSSNPADYTNFSRTDTYPNTATLTGNNTNLSDSASVTVTCTLPQQQAPPVADIAVVKTATPTVVTPGGNVTWTLRATNNGPDAADNATIVDNLPTSLTLVSFTSPAGWDCSGTVTGNPGKLSCTKPTMGVNESATFTLTTTVAASATGQTIDNTAVVSTSTSETTTSNNQDAEPISVQQAVLPPTGGYVWSRIAIAAALVLAGIALLAVERRRRFMS